MNKLSEKVYDRNFETKSCGYQCDQVDNFLDEINQDITNLEGFIESLNYELSLAKDRIEALEKENIELTHSLNEAKLHKNVNVNANGSLSNIDLLNRITNLENMVSELLRRSN